MKTSDRLNSPISASERTRYRLINVVLFGMLAILVLLLRQAQVPSGQMGSIVLWGCHLPQMCIFKRMTGKPCLGCGMTRAMVTLLHGEVAQARAIHPSAPWFGIWLGTQLLARLLLAALPFQSRKLWLTDLILSLATLVAVAYAPIIYSRFT